MTAGPTIDPMGPVDTAVGGDTKTIVVDTATSAIILPRQSPSGTFAARMSTAIG